MRRTRAQWKDEYYLQAFLLCKAGNSDAKVGQLIGASPVVWTKWKATRSALRAALKKGREARRNQDEDAQEAEKPRTFHEYVFGHLPPELRRLWSEIESLEDDVKEGPAKVRELLANSGKKFRQGLFVYALTQSRFNVTEAMRKAMINRRTYNLWLSEDPDFHELVNEVAFHRKNFFENALLRNVAAGDTQAIIFANKTQNKDRGYGESVDVNVSGQINHTHVVVDLNKLDLPITVQRQILDQMKEQKRLEHDRELQGTYTRNTA